MPDKISSLLARHVEVMGELPDPAQTLILPARFVDPVEHAGLAVRGIELSLVDQGAIGLAGNLAEERAGLGRLAGGLRRVALFTDVKQLGVECLFEVRTVRTSLGDIVPGHDKLEELVDQLGRRRQWALFISRSGRFANRLDWPAFYWNRFFRAMRGIKPLELAVGAAVTSLALFLTWMPPAPNRISQS